MNNCKKLTSKLRNFHFFILLPLIITQGLQRLYHIIDNRFINILGNKALLVHNVGFQFITISQLVGVAALTSLLIFWNKNKYNNSHWKLLSYHFKLTFLLIVVYSAILGLLINKILIAYGLSSTPFSKEYLLLNMAIALLQCLFTLFDGALIGEGKYVISLLLALVQNTSNYLSDWFISKLYISGELSVSKSMLLISTSTIVILFLSVLFCLLFFKRNLSNKSDIDKKDVAKTWKNEISIAFFRALAPICLTFLYAKTDSTRNLIITSNLALNVAYIFALPFTAGLPLAIRDASSGIFPRSLRKLCHEKWFKSFVVYSILPTITMFAFGALFSPFILNYVYNYKTPASHAMFLSLFFAASIFGQIGHLFSVPLRAFNWNSKVTKNFIISEIGVHIGLTAFLIYSSTVTLNKLGFAIILFTLTYMLLNIKDYFHINRKFYGFN